MIIEEYHNVWLDNIKTKDKMNMLYNHPSLLQEDYDEISSELRKYSSKKLKYSGYSTLFFVFLYNFAFKNRWYFYNWMNKKPWFGNMYIGRKVKKIGLLYFVFSANLYMFNYFLDKQVLLDLKRQGMYDKYNLEFYFNKVSE